ncbi:hypothetical protein [Lutibacter sp.]|uniref:hypothetical protein n=1 Tax=Lutibacter sp. TaxID=1925666 RepID=UPI00356A98E7
MIHTIKIDLAEVISFKSLKEKKDLVGKIIWQEERYGDAPAIIKYILNDILEAEEEIDKREDVIKALKTLIEKLE